jgi:hypothetical protein
MLCPLCKTEQTEVKKVNSDNFGFICENPKCELKVDLFKVKTWIRKPDKILPPEPVERVSKTKHE